MTEEEKKKMGQTGVEFKENKSFGLPVEEKPFGTNLMEGAKAAAAVPEEKAAAVEAAADDSQDSFYDMISRARGMKAAEDKKNERLQRTKQIISGIADMGSAFANLYYTGQGAPSAYDPRNSMSEKVRERYDKSKAERDKNYNEWLNYVMNVRSAKAEEEENKRKAAAAEEERALKRKRYDLDVSREERLNKETAIRQIRADVASGMLDYKEAELALKKMVAEGKIKTDEYNAETRRISALAASKRADTAAKKEEREAGGKTETETITDEFGIKKTKEKKVGYNSPQAASSQNKTNNKRQSKTRI